MLADKPINLTTERGTKEKRLVKNLISCRRDLFDMRQKASLIILSALTEVQLFVIVAGENVPIARSEEKVF